MKPRLLDLFCGAGGAGMGYHRAGFEVVGVDIKPQPRYPFMFVQGDALEFVRRNGKHFDAIHASPPCQAHTSLRRLQGGKEYPDLVAPTRDALRAAGLPYIVENVVGAPLMNPVQLCGSSFGLDLRRHRLFESNAVLLVPACDHAWQTPRFRSLDARQKSLSSVIGVHGHMNYSGEFALRCAAMGIDWMTNAELTQAIPPAYTEHLGHQLLNAAQLRNAA
jgi:DNA (cytosine-5)-methyltransferase 1